MTINLGEAALLAVLSGAVSGLLAWGGVRVELRYLRRDVDQAHGRIDRVEQLAARASSFRINRER